MNRTTATVQEAKPGFPVGLKTLVGALVIGLLLIAMVIGAGVLEPRIGSQPKSVADRPPNERADMALGQKDWPLAELAFREMLEEDPFDARSMFYMGYTTQNLKRYDESIEWYQKASEFHGFRLFSYYNIACIHALQGNEEDALDALERCIEGNFTTRRGIAADSDFELIKDTERFQALVEREKQTREKRK